MDFFVKDLGWIFCDSPKDVTLCRFSSALSQCLSRGFLSEIIANRHCDWFNRTC